jgi:hypothetical protein
VFMQGHVPRSPPLVGGGMALLFYWYAFWGQGVLCARLWMGGAIGNWRMVRMRKKRWLNDVCGFEKPVRDGYLDLGTEVRCLGWWLACTPLQSFATCLYILL